MASTPAFAVIPRLGYTQLSAASAAHRDGLTTGTTTVIVAGSSGTRIAEVVVEPTVATAAINMVRLFVSGVDSNNNTSVRLFDEVSIPIAAASATVKTGRVNTLYNNLVLPSGYRLVASSELATVINVMALGADL
jgi:hypothetical protein